MPLQFEVNVPRKNTIKYEVVEDGVWAYIMEIPTTRVFGKTEDDACLHLMMLIMNVEDKKDDGKEKP